MAKFDVTVEGVDYEVDAPDEQTAWAWANQTHRGQKAPQPAQTSSVPLTTTADPVAFGQDVAKQQIGDVAGQLAGGLVDPPLPALRIGKTLLGVGGDGGAAKTVESSIDKALGTQGLSPANPEQGVLGAGIRGLLDPLTAVGPGGIIGKLFSGFLGGAGGEMGGQAAREAGVGPGTELAATLAGGLAGGAVPAVTAPTRQAGVEAVRAGARYMGSGGLQRGVTDASTAAADDQVRTLLKQAAASDPELEGRLVSAIQQQQRTGVQLPLSAILQNPVIDAELASLASRNPAFRQAYEAQWKNAQGQVQSRQDRMFGMNPQDAARRLEQFSDPTLDKPVQARLRAFDAAIAKAGELEAKSPGEIGDSVTKLVKQREELARASMKPVYDKVFKAVEGKDVPAEVVQELYDTAKGLKLDDIFFKGPETQRNLMQIWGPKQSPAQYSDTGMVGGGTPEFSAVPIKELDSLKQAINKGIRTTSDRKELENLRVLRNRVSEAAMKIDPEFAQNWKAADAQFAARVGVPFDSETMRMMGRAKYDETVLPILTRNKSSFNEFLAAAGPEGTKMAEDALTYSLWKSSVKDGVLDPKAAQRWIKSHGEQLSMVPGLRDELTGRDGALVTMDKLASRKAALEKNFDQAQQTKILGLENLNPQQLVGKMYSEPQFIDRLLKTHGTDRDNMRALRSFVLDDIMSASNPLEAMQDKRRLVAYGKLFGPSWMNNIKELAEVSGRLARNPADVRVNIAAQPKDFVEEFAPGLSIPKIVTLVRDRWISGWQKVAIGASRVQGAATERIKDERLMEAFLNPAETRKLLEDLKSMEEGKNLGKEAVMRIWNATTEGLSNIPRGAAVGANQQDRQERPYVR